MESFSLPIETRRFKMNQEIKKQWLKELRSGEWIQGRRKLMNDDDKACCLGVLCDIAMRQGVITFWTKKKNAYGGLSWKAGGEAGVLPCKVVEWAGLSAQVG